MDVTKAGGSGGAQLQTVTLLGPLTGSTGPVKAGDPAADMFEPAFGFCGPLNGSTSCYLGDGHSSARVAGLTRPGTGPVSGPVVLAQSSPLVRADFFYLRDDPRKHMGRFSNGGGASGGSPSSASSSAAAATLVGSGSRSAAGAAAAAPLVVGLPGSLLYQALANDTGALDMEACGPLRNGEAMQGAICVVVRGGCFITSKVLACQVRTPPAASCFAISVPLNLTDMDCAPHHYFPRRRVQSLSCW